MTDLDDVLQRHVDKGTVPGAAALVARGDDVEVATAGFMDLERCAPFPQDAVVRAASITKPITAATAMTLVEAGVFALDDAVGEWLPELAHPQVVRTPESPLDDVVPATRDITVEDLLTFLLGYGYPSDFDLPAVQPYFSELKQGSAMVQAAPAPDEWMARLARIPLLHQPGEAWLYNLGTDIAGVLMARACSQPLPELMTERVFEPLGMVDTGFVVPEDKRHRLPSFYRPGEDDALELADPPDGEWSTLPAFPSGSGGLVTTLDDWYAFGRMLLDQGRVGDRTFLQPTSIARMTANHLTAAQSVPVELFLEGQGWGYGGSVDVATRDPWNVPGRYGWVGGTGTAAHVTPSTDAMTILLTQVELTGPTPPEVMRDVWRYASA